MCQGGQAFKKKLKCWVESVMIKLELESVVVKWIFRVWWSGEGLELVVKGRLTVW